MLGAGLQTRSRRFAATGHRPEFRPRSFGLALIIALAVWGGIAGTPRTANAASTAYIAVDSLNLRDAPGFDGGLLATMWYGEIVTVIDGPTGDGWYFVDYNGFQGWTDGEFLSWDAFAPAAAVGGWQATAWVATDLLNVRAEPWLGAWVMDVVSTNDQLTVMGNPVNGFYPVNYWGGSGWVWSDYLTFNGPVALGAEHWIDVDRSSSRVTLLIGDEVVASYWAVMGWDQTDDGFYATANGTYYVYAMNKALTWTDWGNAWITDFVEFDPIRANGFHSYSREADGSLAVGAANATGGCVALDPAYSGAVYDFSFIGMRVEVHW